MGLEGSEHWLEFDQAKNLCHFQKVCFQTIYKLYTEDTIKDFQMEIMDEQVIKSFMNCLMLIKDDATVDILFNCFMPHCLY